jgi:hypothetical protein
MASKRSRLDELEDDEADTMKARRRPPVIERADPSAQETGGPTSSNQTEESDDGDSPDEKAQASDVQSSGSTDTDGDEESPSSDDESLTDFQGVCARPIAVVIPQCLKCVFDLFVDLVDWIDAQRAAGLDPRQVLREIDGRLADQTANLGWGDGEYWNLIMRLMRQFDRRKT